MKYNGYLPNDFVNGENVCVSLWVSGCPLKCKGCQNPETWSFENGEEVPSDLIEQLKMAITANGIRRNFSVLGGEPLAEQNIQFVDNVINEIRKSFPKIKIFLWTGYTIKELNSLSEFKNNVFKQRILKNIDVLIGGRFKQEQRDISLKWRGSKNQRILYKGQHF